MVWHPQNHMHMPGGAAGPADLQSNLVCPMAQNTRRRKHVLKEEKARSHFILASSGAATAKIDPAPRGYSDPPFPQPKKNCA
jgi:hypothetical protein